MNIWYHLVQNVSFSCCNIKMYYCFSSYFHACKTLYPRVRENHILSCLKTWPEERVRTLEGAIKRRLGKSAPPGAFGLHTSRDIFRTIKQMRRRSRWQVHEEKNFGGKTDGYIECGTVRGFRMCENIRDWVRDYHLLKMDAASWSSQQNTT